jgi:hypothetical protein
MELAFALQENFCRWFLRKIAVLRFYLYNPSTSEMSVIGIPSPLQEVGILSGNIFVIFGSILYRCFISFFVK